MEVAMRKSIVAGLMTLSFLTGVGGTYVGYSFIDEKQDRLKEIQQSAMRAAAPSNSQDYTKLEEAYDTIAANYFKKVDQDKLTEGAIKGMLDTLKDPYSTYMDEKKMKQFTDSLGSSFEGIGAEIGMEEGKLIVTAPIKGSPAEKAGIKARDHIYQINGKDIKGLSQTDAVMKIRGKKGTKVKLGVLRPGVDHPLQFEITRDKIPVHTVYASTEKVNGKKIGVMRITSFSEKTSTEFTDNLKDFEKAGIKGLIIDVRGNSGGYLQSVKDMLDQLVTKEKPYAMTEERNGKREKMYSNLNQKKKYPIVVLVDNGSASASEILAGALKEAGGYKLVGENTFGKGTVQQTIPMQDGSTIKLTISKWLTPDGNWIHKKGVKPNITVKQPDYFYLTPLQIKEPLKLDQNSDKIKTAQKLLDAVGYNPGRTDGYFSLQTEQAVKSFQKSVGMKETGMIDTKTSDKLQQIIVEKIRDDKNDLQLKRALKEVSK
jgi:carboxyl-terminal processing protease